MSIPALGEGSLELAKRNAKATFTSPVFTFASTSLFVVVAALYGYAAYGAEAGKVMLGSIASGIGAVMVAFAGVLLFHAIVAPYRQRDELRSAWASAGRLESGELASRASDFARQGDDLLQVCKATGAYTVKEESKIEAWTSKVADFLTRHCASPWAIEFNRASRGTAPMVAKLERRIGVLDGLVESLTGGEPNGDSPSSSI